MSQTNGRGVPSKQKPMLTESVRYLVRCDHHRHPTCSSSIDFLEFTLAASKSLTLIPPGIYLFGGDMQKPPGSGGFSLGFVGLLSG